MNWLLGQPWIIVASGAAVLVVLYGVLHQTGQRWALYSMIAAAFVVAGLVAIERMVVTPEEAIKATLDRIARDVQANDIDAIVRHISRRAPEVQEEARTKLKPWKFKEVKVKQIDDLIVKPDGNPPVASAVVRVLAVEAVAGARDVRYVHVDFVREDGVWRVRGYEDLGSGLPGQ